jgi:hypothetical protein
MTYLTPKGWLEKPQPTAVRLATLEAAARGKDASLRALAINAALVTSDTGFRAAALSHVFSGMRAIVIQSDGAVEKDATISLFIGQFDAVSGTFRGTGLWAAAGSGQMQRQCGGKEQIQGQLSGLRFLAVLWVAADGGN